MKSGSMSFTKVFASALVAGSLAACASAPKANIDASADPSEEINRLNQDISQGYIDQLDVTSFPDFSKAQNALSEAKRELANKDSSEEILGSLRESRGYLNRAISQATTVVPKAQGILDARTAALAAGAHTFPSESASLKLSDDDFRSEVSSIQDNKLSARRWSELQAEYLNLEIRTIQDTKLGEAQSKVATAIDNHASSYAPNVLKRAEWNLQNARNIIATDRHNTNAITPAVMKANSSAELLSEVMNATNGGRVPEKAALQLVRDSRNIASLKNTLEEKSDDVNQADQQLREQQAAISLDQAFNHARRQFKSNEAEVYRQGDKLLIRLKGSNFQVGKSNLNKNSLPLMKKVETITENLHPQQVVIEGNTDSTGSASTNMTLSQNRADEVAKFFENKGIAKDKIETVGYGFKKPLASNKTTTGRAQNRRVDIIVTPSTVSEAATKNTDTSM